MVQSRSKTPGDSLPGERRLTPRTRRNLYSAKNYLETGAQDELELKIPLDVYFQDPAVTEATKELDFDESFTVPWEPGIFDGPTSSRFAVVDYDGTTGVLASPAVWDSSANLFRDDKGRALDKKNVSSHQFHQVNVWATLQNALAFFEDGAGLGRNIQWGFDGGRLIVVPHAGYGENAFYDRESKSLQFYYFDHNGERIHTCLSADIINHEFGHAVLDGLRPLLDASVLVETAAFHEFVGDISAILIGFRNSKLRNQIAKVTGGDLDIHGPLSNLAEQFGRKDGKPYLRSALNDLKYAQVKDSRSPHRMSQAMTGAMFDILREVYRYNLKERGHTTLQALWFTASQMQNLAIQPLDFLPPIDVTFADYADAVLRAYEIVNPTDAQGLRAKLLSVFRDRGILSDDRIQEIESNPVVMAPLDTLIFHDAGEIAQSRVNAYRFLDDNRRELFIPQVADIVVADLSTAVKYTARRRRQAEHVVVQYVWREDVKLVGKRFGRFEGQTTELLCGGTLALDVDGTLLSWARKPGTLPLEGARKGKGTKLDTRVAAEAAAGQSRRDAFLTALEQRVSTGAISDRPASGDAGILAKSMAPLAAEMVDGLLRFTTAPHVGICGEDDDHLDDGVGDRSWSISS